ncbi:MAG: ATP-dependent helicase [Eubacteriales bacterium]|nr:ATP-dependent helicase [Eubacteriales bacterium]
MFNVDQEAAIGHKDGPMMVLAGPGSGKTTVITRRIGQLTTAYGIDERDILVITFTVAAATEMRERYETNVKGAPSGASFGTFHGIFFDILRRELGLGADNILRPDEKYQIFRGFLREYRIEYEDEKEMITGLMSEVSRVKEGMIPLSSFYPMTCAKEVFERMFRHYADFLNERKKIDFDDMQVAVYRLFNQRPEVLARWQKRFRYILIDEFQDINQIQYVLIRMLAKPENNLFIVGDDDQSIYRFRGAKPEIMLGFPKDYPDVCRVTLRVNYRSTPEIVEVGKRLIAHNGKRYPKDLTAASASGEKVTISRFEDEYEQHKALIAAIRRYRAAGIAPERMAVLVRTNIQPRLLALRLNEAGMDFQMKDRIPNIYDHWIAKDILAYVRLAMLRGDKKDFLRVMNRPVRYISRAAVMESDLSFRSLRRYYRSKHWMLGRLSDMEGDLKMLSRLRPAAGIRLILTGIDYDRYIREHAREHGVAESELREVVATLESLAAPYADYDAWFDGIETYVEDLNRRAREKPEEAKGIHVVTMHGAKGLEYEVVFIPDANAGVIPHSRSVRPDEIEEERRLLYVAMTRAIRHLEIYHVRVRMGKECDPSPFLAELYENKV